MDEKIDLPMRRTLFSEPLVKRMEIYCTKLFTTIHLFVPMEFFEEIKDRLLIELPFLKISEPVKLVSLTGPRDPCIGIEVSSNLLFIEELFSFLVKYELITKPIAAIKLEEIKSKLNSILRPCIHKESLKLPEIYLNPERFSSGQRHHVFPPPPKLDSPLSLGSSLESIPTSCRLAHSSHKKTLMQKQTFFPPVSRDKLGETETEKDSSIGCDPMPRHNTPRRHAPSPLNEDLTCCFGIRTTTSSRGRQTESIRLHSSRSSTASDESPLARYWLNQ